MRIITSVCSFIDRDLAKRPRVSAGNLTLLVGILLWLPLIVLRRQLSDSAQMVAFVMTLAATTAWFTLVAWRGWQLFRASASRADRQYDRVGKFNLLPEYNDSESAHQARERKK